MTDTQLMIRWSYARVVTPAHTWHAYPISIIGADGAADVHVGGHGGVELDLTDATVTERLQGGYRIEGTTRDGTTEIWHVSRLSCGCNRHNAPTVESEIPT